MQLSPPRFAAAHARSQQRGIILLLTMFVLFLVIALITQLSLGAEVAHQATANRSSHILMELACKTTAQEVLTMLKDDAAGQASGGLSGALAGPGGFPGMGESGADASSSGGDAGESSAEDGEEDAEESPADSWEDPWAKPMHMVVGDLELTTFVDDENGKFNLHLLLVEDEAQAQANYDRAVRILDALRNDFEDDLDESDARRIVDDLLHWMEVDNRTRRLPAMPHHSLKEEDRYTMLTSLQELLLLPTVTEDLYYDQVRPQERIAPGLESVFTIWTLPAFEEAGSASLAADQAVDEGDAPSLGGAPPAAEESNSSDAADGDRVVQGEGGMEGVLEAEAPIGTLININTAPRAVVEGMFPSRQLPPVKVTALLEYRNKVDEKALDELEKADEDPQDRELRTSIYGDREEDPKQYFHSLEQISEVDGFAAEQLDEETQAELQELLGVQSDVFSVYVFAYQKNDAEWQPERRYQEPPGHALRMKAVVWRATTADGVKLVFLEPWHEVPYARWRIPDFQRDLPPFEPPRYH